MSTKMLKSELESQLLEDIETIDHPSRFELGNDYAVLILRLPEIEEDGLTIHSHAFVVKKGECYRFDREIKELTRTGTLHDMHEFLDERTDRLLNAIQRYHYEIEKLEESLYEGGLPQDFMQKWLAFKKDVSLVHRLMFHATLAFELFIRYLKKNESFVQLDYADLLEHMGRIRDLAKAAMEKLDNLYDFYRAKVDERMNRNMYWLTIISAVFLPLTLVTGFFGMNTGGLPFTDDPHGTIKVTFLSLLLETLFLIPFIVMNSRKTEKFKLRFGKK